MTFRVHKVQQIFFIYFTVIRKFPADIPRCTYKRFNVETFVHFIVISSAINKLYPLQYFNIFENFITQNVDKSVIQKPIKHFVLHVPIFNVREASKNIVKIV